FAERHYLMVEWPGGFGAGLAALPAGFELPQHDDDAHDIADEDEVRPAKKKCSSACHKDRRTGKVKPTLCCNKPTHEESQLTMSDSDSDFESTPKPKP